MIYWTTKQLWEQLTEQSGFFSTLNANAGTVSACHYSHYFAMHVCVWGRDWYRFIHVIQCSGYSVNSTILKINELQLALNKKKIIDHLLIMHQRWYCGETEHFHNMFFQDHKCIQIKFVFFYFLGKYLFFYCRMCQEEFKTNRSTFLIVSVFNKVDIMSSE